MTKPTVVERAAAMSRDTRSRRSVAPAGARPAERADEERFERLLERERSIEARALEIALDRMIDRVVRQERRARRSGR